MQLKILIVKLYIKQVEVIEEPEEDIIESIPQPVVKKMFTPDDYEVALHPSMIHAIIANLNATPHEGYRPIVSIMQNGNLKIDFVKN